MDPIREVSGGPPMYFRFRAGIEHRVKRGRPQWRFVGEYKHVSWRLDGPGMPSRKTSRWFKSRARAVAEANAWLDAREYRAPSLDYVGEAAE